MIHLDGVDLPGSPVYCIGKRIDLGGGAARRIHSRTAAAPRPRRGQTCITHHRGLIWARDPSDPSKLTVCMRSQFGLQICSRSNKGPEEKHIRPSSTPVFPFSFFLFMCAPPVRQAHHVTTWTVVVRAPAVDQLYCVVLLVCMHGKCRTTKGSSSSGEHHHACLCCWAPLPQHHTRIPSHYPGSKHKAVCCRKHAPSSRYEKKHNYTLHPYVYTPNKKKWHDGFDSLVPPFLVA